MRLLFKVIGKPMGKQRPKFSTRITGTLPNGKSKVYTKTYTPQETINYEQLVKLSFLEWVKDTRFTDDDIVEAYIVAFYDIPKSVSKKKREAMMKGIIRPTKKPDVDNITKIILDSLNGIAYRDDAQTTDSLTRKRYVYKDSMQPQVVCFMSNDGSLLKLNDEVILP